jgi:hypothetical protein
MVSTFATNEVHLRYVRLTATQLRDNKLAMIRTYFTPVGKPDDIEVVQQYFQENYWMEQMANRDTKAIWLYVYDRPHNYLVTGIEPYLDLNSETGKGKPAPF